MDRLSMMSVEIDTRKSGRNWVYNNKQDCCDSRL